MRVPNTLAFLVCTSIALTASESVLSAQGPGDPARRAELVRKFDTDGDGELSMEEMDAARQMRGGRGSNNSARPERYPQGQIQNDHTMQELLERFDKDKSGDLSFREMAALRNALRMSSAKENTNGEIR
jgi:hypothetical protein